MTRELRHRERSCRRRHVSRDLTLHARWLQELDFSFGELFRNYSGLSCPAVLYRIRLLFLRSLCRAGKRGRRGQFAAKREAEKSCSFFCRTELLVVRSEAFVFAPDFVVHQQQHRKDELWIHRRSSNYVTFAR